MFFVNTLEIKLLIIIILYFKEQIKILILNKMCVIINVLGYILDNIWYIYIQKSINY